jgi:hypothetical protein
MGALESGTSFLAGVLAKLPPEQRAQAEAVFNQAEARDAVTLVGDSVLARADYSRHMDELREKEQALTDYYTKLNGWYAENETALAEARNQAVRNPDPAAAGAPSGLQSPGLTAEQIRAIAQAEINDAGRDYISVAAFIATQGDWHRHVFNEPLDATELVNNPKLGRPIIGQPGRVYSLQDAYQEKYGAQIQQKNQEAQERRFEQEVEKRLADRTRASAGQPFPLRSESSPLDVLTTKDGSAAHTLDSAVAEYERLVAAKQT